MINEWASIATIMPGKSRKGLDHVALSHSLLVWTSVSQMGYQIPVRMSSRSRPSTSLASARPI